MYLINQMLWLQFIRNTDKKSYMNSQFTLYTMTFDLRWSLKFEEMVQGMIKACMKHM